jgi:hypothetical protein
MNGQAIVAKQIKLTAPAGTPEKSVKAFYEWLIAKRVKNEIPFNVVMIDTDAHEQYGIVIHCRNRSERDLALTELLEMSLGTSSGASKLASVMRGLSVGRVFEP